MTVWPRTTAPVLHCLCVLILLTSPLAGSAQTPVDLGQRSALIVGNAAYRPQALANPINDARAMAGLLRELGFSVTLIEDASLDRLRSSLDEVAERFPAAGVGVFYYAGHAVQYRGTNYLLPVDFNPKEARDVPARSITAASVLEALQAAGVGHQHLGP